MQTLEGAKGAIQQAAPLPRERSNGSMSSSSARLASNAEAARKIDQLSDSLRRGASISRSAGAA